MKRKNEIYGVWGIFAVVVLCLLFAGMPNMTANAVASQKVVTKKIAKTKFKKVKKSSKSGIVRETAGSSSHQAVWEQTGKEYEDGYINVKSNMLYITKDGKSYSKIDLAKTVRSKLGLSNKKAVVIWHLTCIKDTFYITGCYADSMWDTYHATPFYLSTKNGRSITVKKLSVKKDYLQGVNFYGEAGNAWNLYYVAGQYVASTDILSRKEGEEGYPYYYTSNDLKNWKQRRMDYGYSTLRIAAANSKCLVFCESEEEPASEDYNYTTVQRYFYTTNFSKYNKLNTLNKNLTSKPLEWLKGTEFTEVMQLGINDDGKMLAFQRNGKADQDFYEDDGWEMKSTATGFVAYRASKTNKFEKFIEYKGNWKSVFWRSDWAQNAVYLTTAKKNFVYLTSSFSGKAKKYTTSLSADKMASGVSNGKLDIDIYNGRYLLVSRNGGKTVAKIDTHRKNLTSLAIVGKNVVLMYKNAYDYYIPLSTIQKAVK